MSTYLYGLDLGGTKIEGVVLNPENPRQPLARLRVPTESAQGYDHILNQIAKLVQMLHEETDIAPERVGIGTPGAFDPHTGLQKNSNTTCLNDRPLLPDLEQKLGVPVRMANDANCFALAEARLGAVPAQVPNAQVVFGIIMGTGVGGGLVVNGQVLNGSQGIAGEWGHNFLDESGGPCYCGSTGCVETVIAGPSLERWYREQSGVAKPLKTILEDHLAGTDPWATATIERLLDQFGKAVSVLVNILDPDAIVIGGGVGNIDLLYTEGVQRAKAHVFNNRLDTVFLKPTLGDSAGVFGAAMLWA